MSDAPTLVEIRAAAQRITPYVHHTPVMRCRHLDSLTGATLFFKCENLQRVGAFKFRGATNAVLCLDDEEARRGVVTHSSGNHAQALALAARQREIAATIVMPRDAPRIKRAAVEGYGARVIACEPTLEDRQRAADAVVEETGGTLVHPYNDVRIIAGAATAALELCEEVSDLNAVIAPVGGGGLLSGTALSAHGVDKAIRVHGAEPSGADDAFRSLQAGRLIPLEHAETIADGLRTSLGCLTFPILKQHVESILTVDDSQTLAAMRIVWERMKLVIEPSAAVAVAALIHGRVTFEGQRVGVILSGGNVDLDRLPWG
jgi:threonine dehydratase